MKKLNSQYPFIMGIRRSPTPKLNGKDYLAELAQYNSTIYREGSTEGFRRDKDTDTDAKKFVQNALNRALGRRLNTTDPKAMLATIDRAFMPTVNEVGNKIFEWTPRTYAVQTELGGKITGAQASLYRRAKAALDEILPLLDRLESLKDAPDEEEVNAYRAIVRQEVISLVDELGIEGGWRESRVNLLFDNLLGHIHTTSRYGTGHLFHLSQVFGIDHESIVTVEEEETFTDFTIIFDYIQNLYTSWRNIFEPKERLFLGTKIVKIERALHSLVEGVDELRYVMESVGLGEAERRVVRLEYLEVHSHEEELWIHYPAILTIEEMLDWIVSFATEEAPSLIENGGNIGLKTLLPTLHRLHQIVSESLNGNDTHSALRTSRVINAVEELASHILEVSRNIEDDDMLIIFREFRHKTSRTHSVANIAKQVQVDKTELSTQITYLLDDPVLIRDIKQDMLDSIKKFAKEHEKGIKADTFDSIKAIAQLSKEEIEGFCAENPEIITTEKLQDWQKQAKEISEALSDK